MSDPIHEVERYASSMQCRHEAAMNRSPWLLLFSAAIALVCVALGASRFLAAPVSVSFPADGPKIPRGLVPIIWPKDNPYTAAKAELGWLLYFDKRLSVDGTVSCASCHDPKFAFTDGAAFSKGIRGQLGGRSAPTVINRAYSLEQFWDGRAASLEEQAKGPIANPIEMGHTHDGCAECIARRAGLSQAVQRSVRHREDHHRPHRQGHRHLRADGALRQLALRQVQGRRQDRAHRKPDSAAWRSSSRTTPAAIAATRASTSPTASTRTSASAWTSRCPTSAATW